MEVKKRIKVLSIALAICLLFLVFLIIALIYSEHQTSLANLNIYGKANVFDTQFHDLLQENSLLLINTARRSLDSSASFNDSYNALHVSINEVAAQISTFYGPDIANQFRALWNTKTDIFINYSIALKNNDNTTNSVFASRISAYEENMAEFWSNTSNPLPTFDKTIIKQEITAVSENIKAAIDFWNAKDYPDYFSKLHDSYTQTGKLADIFAQAIINDNKDKFK